MTGNILRSIGNTLVLINYSIDTQTNIINAGLAYIAVGNISPVTLKNLTTGETFIVNLPTEVEQMKTYGVYDDCDLEIH